MASSSPPEVRLPTAEELLYRVDPNLSAAIAVRNYLNRMTPAPERLERVSVTKLVNPGQAYYDVVSPLEEEIGAFQKRMAGTGAHDRIEELLGLPAEYWLDGKDAAGEPALDRITAKLDSYVALADGSYVPVEIKNVGSSKPDPAIAHLEQLGMYCALLSSGKGLILRVLRNDQTGESTLLSPLEVRYPDLDLVRREMARRRDLLIEAVAARDPSKLPACSWSRYRCKYREAGVCGCSSRPPLEPNIAATATWKEAPEFLKDIERHQTERLSERREHRTQERLTPARLLLLRKVYFDIAGGDEGAIETEEGAGVGKAVAKVNTRGLESQLYAAIRGANRSRFGQSQAALPGVKGTSLSTIDGNPFLVKVRMIRNPVSPTAGEAAGKWGVPEEVRKLAVQAVLTGATVGRLYVWNWKLEGDEGRKLQVLDLKFHAAAMAQVESFVRGAPGLLAAALARKDPGSLPLCPRWMCPRCAYLEECRPGPDPDAPAT